ncbi:thiamine pyrophosphate-dependent dehydrogenase E1 component subunit alpha [SAR116 cluster bacterium]|nr:thiamine pyrophosphate-dependent dehydrogenase E1 component subunit alpha [SAR116 cluster bacterium]
MNEFNDLFYQALRIRMVEEEIIKLYPSDQIQSPVHLSIGQEAVAVGLCRQLTDQDLLFNNYRGHAYYLAKGGDLEGFFAELFGKKTGISKGKAGSMHLSHPSTGVMGASAVVGSTISHAVGAALSGKIQGTNNAYVTVFGDGATEQGVYHESLNFASLHNLNVFFVCENNGLAVHSHLAERQSYDLRLHADTFGIDYFFLEEGYDFMAVNGVAESLIGKIKKNNRPIVLEVKTCRYKEHVGPGDDFCFGYRSEALVETWKSLDPLCQERFKGLVLEFAEPIKNEIDRAVSAAQIAPLPDKEDLMSDVI